VPDAGRGVRRHLDLEDQVPRGPEADLARRTQGGYRLFSTDDVERLRAILRMQRDEFLPLAVIRDLLTQGASRPSGTRRRRAARWPGRPASDAGELASETDADLRFIRSWRSISCSRPRTALGKPYTRTDVEIVSLCQRLARYGVAARH